MAPVGKRGAPSAHLARPRRAVEATRPLQYGLYYGLFIAGAACLISDGSVLGAGHCAAAVTAPPIAAAFIMAIGRVSTCFDWPGKQV